MGNEQAYVVTLPVAALLASLMGIKNDFERVVAYCDRMVQRYSGSHLQTSPLDIVGFTTHVDFDDWEALASAACIAYARPFATGVRERMDTSLVDECDDDMCSLHDFIIDLRNRHIAHSVNAFEENLVTVQSDSAFESPEQITNITPSHSRVVGLSFDIPAKLRNLANWWLTRIDKEIANEREKVLAVVRQTPLRELTAQPAPGPGPTANATNAKTPRRFP